MGPEPPDADPIDLDAYRRRTFVFLGVVVALGLGLGGVILWRHSGQSPSKIAVPSTAKTVVATTEGSATTITSRPKQHIIVTVTAGPPAGASPNACGPGGPCGCITDVGIQDDQGETTVGNPNDGCTTWEVGGHNATRYQALLPASETYIVVDAEGWSGNVSCEIQPPGRAPIIQEGVMAGGSSDAVCTYQTLARSQQIVVTVMTSSPHGSPTQTGCISDVGLDDAQGETLIGNPSDYCLTWENMGYNPNHYQVLLPASDTYVAVDADVYDSGITCEIQVPGHAPVINIGQMATSEGPNSAIAIDMSNAICTYSA